MTSQTPTNSTPLSAPDESAEKLRVSETRYRRLFEAARDGIVILDFATRKITDANPFMVELLGYTREEFLGRELWEIGLLRDAEASAQALRVLQENGFIRYDNLPLQTKSGEVREVEFISNVYDEGAQQVIQCNIRDNSERKRATIAEQESQRFLQGTLDALGAQIAVLDEAGKIIAVNKAWRRFSADNNGTYNEIGVNYLEVCNEAKGDWAEEAPAVAQAIRDVMAGRQQVFCLEYPCHSPTEERWFNMCVTRFVADGQVCAVVAHDDITARKQSEKRLQQSEANLARAQQIARIGSWELDLVDMDNVNRNPLRWSDEVFRIFGHEPGEIEVSNENFFRAVHPEDRVRIQTAMDEALHDGKSYDLEHRILLPDGSVRMVQEQSEITFDENTGKLLKMVGTVQDITERKQIEQSLRQANDELERAQNALEQRVLERTAELQQANWALQNNEARLLQGNRIFTELASLRVADLAGLEKALQQITEAGSKVLDAERCSVWVYNEDHSVIRCLDLYETKTQGHSQGAELAARDFSDYFRALESGRTIVANDAHAHYATRSFSESYLKPLGIVSMLDAAIVIGGKLAGVLCCERTGAVRPWKVDDQTFGSSAAATCALALESYQRSNAEAQMQRAHEEADAANRAKSEFLSRMSHELRTPLNAILGFGQILGEEDLQGIQKESVEYILKAGRHLLDLINEVLDIERVEAGYVELSIKPISLGEVVPEVCTLLSPLAAERHIDVNLDLSNLRSHSVLADHQRFKQVLINLLSNAIKYNTRGGQVVVSCSAVPNNRIRLAVRDTGPGIAAQDLAKLFSPFERLGAANSEVEGTGLGLVLSKHLMAAMDGTLEVQSIVGAGSTFSVELPTALLPHEETESAAPQSAGSGTQGMEQRKYSVLCIEDNASNLRLVEMALASRPEIGLLSAMCGIEGLEMALRDNFDLILLDLNLPDISGQEILQRLQASETTRSTPVVVISADVTEPQIQMAMDAGATTYLTKPLDIAKFLRMLGTVLQ